MNPADEVYPAPACEDRALSWSRTVARELVHRVSVAEVLLTDVRSAGGGRFEAASQWTRSHPTFPRGGDGRHHPLMVVETLRQLGIYVPLRYYGVDPDAHFLIRETSYALDPDAEPRAVDGASDVVCEVAVSHVRTDPSGMVGGLRLTARFRHGGRPFAVAAGTARMLGAARYRELRGPRVTAVPQDAAAPGQPRPGPGRLALASPLDAMLAHDGGAPLISPADPWHPFFFDHGSDHVPGMVLLEAARQAAALCGDGTRTRPVAGRLAALGFTELRPQARVYVLFHGRVAVFRVRHGDVLTAAGTLHYSE
ncbi:ScbA/BarX family gamma-butyrolactone biosynthesis protein [Streptomyces sp. TRM 70351]|uniref:ScbA/BarX family gamma-butyrolactone biosynthesis protein n=1 Tax=Streptomyces sp. TRM 70351 TaxID=3116552 RepID=UPI002E7BF572|nr:ScbA/BarX family gamma-butyrolactone biosynthesis protein [Streptomyces sp. TRM 70351]MEE1930216.1 ScbA/BarX family gamma-butyrolactone biosynthesis protein [Streptomyces sp. TRM 70351]